MSITHRIETKRELTTNQEAKFITESTDTSIKNDTPYKNTSVQNDDSTTESTGMMDHTLDHYSVHSESTAKVLINESTGTSKEHFLIVVCPPILLALLFVLVVVRYKMKFKKLDRKNPEMPSQTTPPLKRKRTFDAIIFYHFDSNNDSVLNQLLPELEDLNWRIPEILNFVFTAETSHLEET